MCYIGLVLVMPPLLKWIRTELLVMRGADCFLGMHLHTRVRVCGGLVSPLQCATWKKHTRFCSCGTGGGGLLEGGKSGQRIDVRFQNEQEMLTPYCSSHVLVPLTHGGGVDPTAPFSRL